MEDRPGPPAAPGLDSGGRGAGALRGGGHRCSGEGRGGQPRLRAGTRDHRDRGLSLGPLITPKRRGAAWGEERRWRRATNERASDEGRRASKAPRRRKCRGANVTARSAVSQLGGALGDRGLAVGRLVLVDDTLADGLVQLHVSGPHGLGGLVGIAGVRGLPEVSYRRLQRRLDGLVALARLLVLLVALDLGLDIRHACASLEVWSGWSGYAHREGDRGVAPGRTDAGMRAADSEGYPRAGLLLKPSPGHPHPAGPSLYPARNGAP